MIYLDNAATTEMDQKALVKMLYFLKSNYGNPLSQYSMGEEAHRALVMAREQIAEAIGAEPREIYFTSGGSESDNWAIKSVAGMYRRKKHIITTGIEHPAVYNTCRALEKQGFRVTYLPVDSSGMISVKDLEIAMDDETCLVSVMHANNETGTIQPIEEAADIARSGGAWFHTDAVQTVGHIPVDVEKMHIDLLSASGHKFGGPKGVGFLYVRKGLELEPLIHGGGQERGRRAGTHNVAGIAAMGTALAGAAHDMDKRIKYEKYLRDFFISRVLKEIPETSLNGSPDKRLPGNVNITFRGCENETVLFRLDQQGICASAGSACSAGAIEPSRVLRAIGLPDREVRESVRFSLSYRNTAEEINKTVDTLKGIVTDLRRDDR
jgi:cysteine desulfurase